jgi:hypothetical protein
VPGEPVDFVDGDEAHVECALEYDALDDTSVGL